jgi:serine protease Do
MTTFKAAACVLAFCGASAGAAVVPTHDSDAQAVAIKRAQAPTAIFAGGARLGVTVRDIEDSEVKGARLSAAAGAVVEEVSDGSAAEAGGIRKGDVIVEFDGERVRSARQFTRLVQESADGRKVNAVVVRDGQRMTLSVEPRQGSGALFEKFRRFEDFAGGFNNFAVPVPPARPAPTPRVSPPSPWVFDDFLPPGSARLGLTVDTLSPQLAEYFGTKEGVLVKSVQDNSTAAKIGIRAGDVITSVNGSTINDAAELRRRLQSLKEGDEMTIGIMRDKKAQTLKGKMEGTGRRRTYRSTV